MPVTPAMQREAAFAFDEMLSAAAVFARTVGVR
jgi:hypothetical protein